VRDGGPDRAGHGFEALAKILLLHRKRHFQDPRKNLLMAKLHRFLDALRRIHGGQPGMFVSPRRKVP